MSRLRFLLPSFFIFGFLAGIKVSAQSVGHHIHGARPLGAQWSEVLLALPDPTD